jgi:serine/threonine-protein phosphatase PGAM5
MPQIITLIRHGQYDTRDNHPDGGILTSIGRQQATQTGLALKHSTVDAIYASTMRRAMETAELIGAVLDVPITETLDDLREVVPTVPPEMRPYVDDWIDQGKPFADDDITRQRTKADRAFERFFASPMSNDEHYHILLVCHGNILRYLSCKALGIDVDTWVRLNINHCGMTTLARENGILRLVAHNEHHHLDVPLRTE